ncbi:TSUP family transporter [Vibrio gallicus]|uniref:TSUP family transporter n=1 Tax=Vibrio gallicus TaxID=190897 RepID=UPI0021C3AEB8|nr:TSUP family transporter [Vibrio gallicus]
MEISIQVLTLLFFVAGLAGFIDAMAGGGGLLTVPALLAAGLPPTQALATNKLQSSFGSFSASLYFVRSGFVSLKEMRLAIFFTFIGAAIGSNSVQYIDASILTSLIPILLILISGYFLLAPPATESSDKKPRISDAMFALVVGCSVGFYDGFFGPGTGSIFTVCFVAIANCSLVQATARTKILNFTSNITALTFFIIAGLPVWKVGLLMAIGGFLGARLGAKVVINKGQKWVRPMVILMSMIMASKLLWEQHHQWFVSLF